MKYSELIQFEPITSVIQLQDKAAKKGIEGALIGGLFGLNSLFDDNEDED